MISALQMKQVEGAQRLVIGGLKFECIFLLKKISDVYFHIVHESQ